jgi:hypothetical protein
MAPKKKTVFLMHFLSNDLTHEEEIFLINSSKIDLGIRSKFVEDCFSAVENNIVRYRLN